MKSLYFNGIPVDHQNLKTARPGQVSVIGGYVYASEVFKALLSYGSFDQIFVPPLSRTTLGDLRDSTLFKEQGTRIQILGDHQLSRLKTFDHAVFFTPFMDLSNLARLRRVSGALTASVTGVIHSINYSYHLIGLILQLLSPLGKQDAIICPSSAGKIAFSRYIDLVGRRLKDVGWPQLTAEFQTPVIPLGVEVPTLKSEAKRTSRQQVGIPDEPTILYFGRFSASSKSDLIPLILAYAQVIEEHPRTTLVLAGDDTQCQMTPVLREFAKEVVPQGSVIIVPDPTSEQKSSLYTAADVFVSPSDSLQETFGITVIEAMAHGLPTVVSDWDGYKDIVFDGVTGYRVRTVLPHFNPCFDDIRGQGLMLLPDMLAATTIVDIRDLYAKLSALISNPEMCTTMGEAARQKVERDYAWPVVIHAYERLWAESAQLADKWHKSPGANKIDVSQYSYTEIFSHYGTDTIDESATIMCGEKGIHPDTLLKWLSKTIATCPWLRPEIFERIITVVNKHNKIMMSDVLTELGYEDELDKTIKMAHVCRLLKYGVLESSLGADIYAGEGSAACTVSEL